MKNLEVKLRCLRSGSLEFYCKHFAESQKVFIHSYINNLSSSFNNLKLNNK